MPRPVFHCLPLLFLACLRGEDVFSYADHAKPIFSNTCNNCHNPDKKKGGLDLTTYAGVMAGGSGGDVVTAGDADGSKLLRCVLRLEEPFMPPKGDRLNDSQVDTLRRWIAGGLRETKTGSARAAAPKRKAAAFAGGSVGKPAVTPVLFPDLPLVPARVTFRPAPVLALATNPWAPVLAVGAPGQVVFYDTATLAPRGVLPFAGMPRVLSFSSSGAVLLAAGGETGRNGQVTAWTIATAQPLLGFEAEMDEILAADLRPDFGELALGGSARRVRYLNASGEKQDENKKHTEWITAAAYSPDGVLLATADRNGGVRVWEAATRSELHELRGHDKSVTALAWRPDSNVLATVSEDGTARLWEMAGGTNTKKWDAHGSGVTDVAFAPDGSLATVGRNSKLKHWDGDGKLRREYVNLPAMPLRVRFSFDSKRIFVGDFEGRILVFEPESKEPKSVAELGSRLPSLDDRVCDAEKRITEARVLLSGAPSPARQQAEAALEAGKNSVAAAEKSRDEAKAAAASSEKKLGDVRNRVTQLEQQLKAAREGRDKLTAELAEVTRQAGERRAERDRLKASAQKAAERLARADADLAQLPATAAQPDRQRVSQIQADAERESRETGKKLSETVAAAEQAETRQKDLAGRLEKTQAEEKERDRELAEARPVVAPAETDLKKLREAVAPADQAVAEAKKKLPPLEQAVAAAGDAVTNAAATLAQAENDLKRWQAEKLKATWWNELVRLHGLVEQQPDADPKAPPADSPEVAAQKARVAEAEKAWKAAEPAS